MVTFEEIFSKTQLNDMLAGSVPTGDSSSITFPTSEIAYIIYHPEHIHDENEFTGYAEVHLKSNFVFYVLENDSLKESLFDTNLRNMFGIPNEKEN